MTRDMQREDAFNAGVEAAIFQWSNEKMDTWCKENQLRIDDFEAGIAHYLEEPALARKRIEED